MIAAFQHTLIALQLSGGGALASFAASLIEKAAPAWLVLGVVVAAVGLLLIAAVGAWLCLFTAPLTPPGNTPKNLYESDLPVDALRAGELASVELRLSAWADRNGRVGTALNWLYAATAAAPLLAIAAAVLAR